VLSEGWERRRREHAHIWVTLTLVVVVLAGLAVAALFTWPRASLGADSEALAHLSLPGFAGKVTSVDVRSATGARVPVRLQGGRLWPRHKLAAGERLTVAVTVKRPGWAGWLVGKSERRIFTIRTPSARLLNHWLQVKTGDEVVVAFDEPVSVVSLQGGRPQKLASPRKVVPLGVVARGSDAAGAMTVAAVARTWERLPAPAQVSWFPWQPYLQMLAQPVPKEELTPDGQLTLTFSSPVADVLGTRPPKLTPATSGHWSLLDEHTLAFEPSGFGFGLGATVRVVLPKPVHLASRAGTAMTRTVSWQVQEGSTLRLQQLLAEVGYLPLDWRQTDGYVAATPRAQVAAAMSPPAGRFDWRFPNTPPELRSIWHPGDPNQITRGAVMMFEDEHGLAVDALAGPRVWRALISDAIAGKRRDKGYSYVFVHRSVPQSLNLWHNGRVILSSPGNTGVPAAPTQLGTFPVFEHILVGTMSGTNPDGSHYHDPGIRYISYFNDGDAIHAFNRASFGTPQSLGCVELPLAAAKKVWPYTPIGTLVTIEN
jgi:peptidoglycan hydrolase-like protein with peptidoglycan-binding domain